MAQTEFLGAKASNAGDSFHELWALHAALELMKARTPLTAVTVEGVRAIDSASSSLDAWSGVDCGLYFEGDSFATARRIELVQLKYSTANSDKNWTAAGLTASTSKNKNNSVIRQLANQFSAAYAQRQSDPNTKWEIPRLCRGGSRTLRIPGVFHPQLLLSCNNRLLTTVLLLRLLLLFTGCDQAPLRGQQP